MKAFVLGLCIALTGGVASSQDMDADFERVYSELGIDKVLVDLDEMSAHDQRPDLFQQLESRMGRKLTDVEKGQIAAALPDSVAGQ